MKQHIPNSLTVLRLLLAIAFPFVPESWRLPIFVVAAFTEFADGFLGRRWNVTSDLGRTLDPIADKAFVLSVIATLFFAGTVALWEYLVLASVTWSITEPFRWSKRFQICHYLTWLETPHSFPLISWAQTYSQNIKRSANLVELLRLYQLAAALLKGPERRLTLLCFRFALRLRGSRRLQLRLNPLPQHLGVLRFVIAGRHGKA